MTSQTGFERKRLLADLAHMLFRSLLVGPLVGGKVVASAKSLAALTLVVPLFQVNGVDVHFHVWPLSKVSAAMRAAPFLLAAMGSCDMSLQGIATVESVRAMRAMMVTTLAMLRGHVDFEVVAPGKACVTDGA